MLVAAGIALSACKGAPPSIYCVFESEVLAGGGCLTECESRCNLQIGAGCASATCVGDCEARASGRSTDCLDASYSYWRCLRVSGLPQVTCRGAEPVFSVPDNVCASSREVALARCPALTDASAGDAELDSGGDGGR